MESGKIGSAYERLIGGCLYPFYESTLRRRGTFRYRAWLERSQWRSPEEIRAGQWRELRALLRHAYDTVEYYRAAWDAAGVRPEDIRCPEDLVHLPILTKADVREHHDRLISSRFGPERLIRSATGGSTGEPMRFGYDRNSYEWRTAVAMRGDSWAGWRLCGPEFYLWGAQLLPQSGLLRLKKQLHHAALRRDVVSSFELSAERIHEIVRRYNRLRPRVAVGYANALYEFARYVTQAGLSLRPPLGVISSAEKLYTYQREAIEKAFGAPVFDRYGCREVMMVAAECSEHGGLHVAADNVLVEVTRRGQLCEPGEMGEILLTDLHNYGMPLIRYQVGDIGSWKGHDCPCGRGLPLMKVVEGRTLGLISTPSGRVVSGEFFPHLLKDFPAILAYQVVQDRREEVTIRATLSEALPIDQERLLKEAVARALGPEVRVTWEMGPGVRIERAQKFRPVISSVPVDLAGSATDAS